MTDALTITGLQVTLSGGGQPRPTLDGIDLALAAGRVLGLIGESGSGKTTLAHAILGILPAHARITAGRITLADPVEDGPSGLAYVPQDASTALDPLFTIGQQVNDILASRRPDLRGRAARLSLAARHMQSVNLPDPDRLLRRRPHELSGGQRQRLTIAVAVMVRPVLLIADEPTTALDLTTQAQVLRLLRDLVDGSGMAMLITTHDPGVAHEICDQVAVMHAGRIVEQADTAVLLHRAEHPYTRRLLDARNRVRPSGPAVTGPIDHPSGCAFRSSCSDALSHCATEAPPIVQRGSHRVRCWRAVTA